MIFHQRTNRTAQTPAMASGLSDQRTNQAGGALMPLVVLFILSALFAAAAPLTSWKRRFSLRALLIAMTLIAAGLVLIVRLVR
jgi:hypothetical protein